MPRSESEIGGRLELVQRSKSGKVSLSVSGVGGRMSS